MFWLPVELDCNTDVPIAILPDPVVFQSNANLAIATLVVTFQFPFPILTPLIVASAVVTRLPDAPERRNPSILFLLNTRSWLSVVPMN